MDSEWIEHIVPLLIVSEGSSVEADEDVMNRLRELHADALDNNSCLLTCAQNLITILGHHTRKNYQVM